MQADKIVSDLIKKMQIIKQVYDGYGDEYGKGNVFLESVYQAWVDEGNDYLMEKIENLQGFKIYFSVNGVKPKGIEDEFNAIYIDSESFMIPLSDLMKSMHRVSMITGKGSSAMKKMSIFRKKPKRIRRSR